MGSWELPKHLEPYRGLIDHWKNYRSIEEQAEDKHNAGFIFSQVAILQRLYDAGKLK